MKGSVLPETHVAARLRATPAPLPAGEIAAAVGHSVRSARAKRGMTRRQLAQASGASERYLAQIEGGGGNPSIVMLNAIAHALDVPITDLLPPANGSTAPMARILDVLGRLPPSDLPGIAELIEARADEALANERAQRIALIGLREMGGLATFRRHERACLDRVIEREHAAVIATAGGIVSNAQTFAFLLRRCHTVWIKARPEEHMSRVMQQGDFRPMAKSPEAMADLAAILEARASDYARAYAELDTSGDTVARSSEKLLRIVKRCLAGAQRSGRAARATNGSSRAR